MIINTADKYAVPAGGVLAVDRSKFSTLTEVLSNHPLVQLIRIEQLDLPSEESITVIATGPLTSDKLASKIKCFAGVDTWLF